MSSVDPGRYVSAPGEMGRSHIWVGARKSNQPVMAVATSGCARVAVVCEPVIELMTVSPVTDIELAKIYRRPTDTSRKQSTDGSATPNTLARVYPYSSV